MSVTSFYSLKRQYGARVRRWRGNTSALVWVILLPSTTSRHEYRGVPFTTANRAFAYGGAYDVDQQDILTPDAELFDWFDLGTRYEVAEVHVFGDAVLARTRSIGEKVLSQDVGDDLNLEQSA